MSKYGLYYTLNNEIDDRDPGEKRKNKLYKNILALDKYGQEAILLLVVEYARDQDDYNIDSHLAKNSIKLPYSIKNKGNILKIDIDKLPNSLIWILIKFCKVAKKNSE